jgi:hypothetical protein
MKKRPMISGNRNFRLDEDGQSMQMAAKDEGSILSKNI